MHTRLGAVELKGGFSVLLCAPDSYWDMSPAQLSRICNGCGTSHAGWLVPDTLYGMEITEACNIHDYGYHIGETLQDKEQADREFLNNMLRLIQKAPTSHLRLIGPVLSFLRRRRALKYYHAVSAFGGPAFWGKK